MFQIISLIFFLLIISSFGFISLNRVLKIKSLIFLISLSFPLGIASYIFTTHLISYITGPRLGCIISLALLLLLSFLFVFFLKGNVENELKKKELNLLALISITISILTYLSMFRFGFFDKPFHIPLTLTMFHNNFYPPKDFFRPYYVLLYHYGGDLLAGSINHISKIDLSTCFEIVSSIFSGVSFLCFFLLALTMTKNYKTSMLAGFCTYFGGGFLWLDAIIRYFSQNLPPIANNWGLIQTLCNLGLHGSIINPPSMIAFSATSSIGTPLLVMSLILLWNMISLRMYFFRYIIFLVISLLSLFLCAEWLYLTFFVGIFPVIISILIKKDWKLLKTCSLLLFTTIAATKTIGDPLFLQEATQSLGRINIFSMSLKEQLFTVNTWGRLNETLNKYSSVSCFSWNFFSEFGLSLILIPIAVIYIIRRKDLLGLSLLSCAIFTMPAPIIIDFKVNPTDLNRLFCFGNSMLVLLITCGVSHVYKDLFNKKTAIIAYIFLFSFSPILQLIAGSLFTPNIFMERSFSQDIFNGFRKVNNFSDLLQMYKDFNKLTLLIKNETEVRYKEEISLLEEKSMPGDVALSSIPELPFYAGVYSLVQPGRFLYQDFVHSLSDSTYLTTFSSLDPHILNELNVQWIITHSTEKTVFPQEIKTLLNNKDLFESVYFSGTINEKNNWIEIYKVKNFKNILNQLEQKATWILTNNLGEPIETNNLKGNKITLFNSSQNALVYLNQLINANPSLKKEPIIVKLVIIKELQDYLKKNKLDITLDKFGF